MRLQALVTIAAFVNRLAQEFANRFKKRVSTGFCGLVDTVLNWLEDPDEQRQELLDFVKGFLFAAFLIVLYLIGTAIAEP